MGPTNPCVFVGCESSVGHEWSDWGVFPRLSAYSPCQHNPPVIVNDFYVYVEEAGKK